MNPETKRLTIWKYPVQVKDFFTLEMPAGAKFLSVQVQADTPQMWFVVDIDGREAETREFFVFGTGHECSTASDMEFLGTFQLSGGLVFHLFTKEPLTQWSL